MKLSFDPKQWIADAIIFLKNFPKLPRDEQMAWIAVFLGAILIITGFFI